MTIGTEGEAGSDLISGCDSVDEAGEAGEGDWEWTGDRVGEWAKSAAS